MISFIQQNRMQAQAETAPIIIKSRPLMLWVSAVSLILSMAWEIIPLTIIIFNAMADDQRLGDQLTFFGVVILLCVVIETVICVSMAVGLLRKTEWAWMGTILSVHGIFAPPLIVLIILYLLNLIFPVTHPLGMKYMMSDFLLRVMAPYGLTYLFLLFCLTRRSVKQALSVE